MNVVGEADDGTTALELIKEHRPDVALLDYRMPGMDGAQVAAAVRSNDLPTRVLLLSAHDESAIVYQALQQGAAGFSPRTRRAPRSSRPSSIARRAAMSSRPRWSGPGRGNPEERRAYVTSP